MLWRVQVVQVLDLERTTARQQTYFLQVHSDQLRMELAGAIADWGARMVDQVLKGGQMGLTLRVFQEKIDPNRN